jgi:uncharacterized protein (TIGR03032 family)
MTTEKRDDASASEPWLDVSASREFPAWLEQQKISIAFTTYQAGKLLLLGLNHGRLAVHERTYSRCMGLSSTAEVGHVSKTFWLASHYQIWRMENALNPGQNYEGHDALFVPRIGYTTGDLDVHDVTVESSGRIVFVNTHFSCLSTIDEQRSFTPLWKPPFISKLAPEDRCHLNGLTLQDGKAAYVTMCAKTDVADGWRDHRAGGGCVMDVRSNETIVAGLAMPHSPRLHDGTLYMHHSGQGYFGKVDLKQGKFEPIAFCPGYLRGLAIYGRYAVVGLSKPREKTFRGLPLDTELASRNAVAQCGLQVIDLTSGNVVHWVRVEGIVSELYDVAVLQNVVRPMSLGFKTDEIRRIITMNDEQKL